MSGQTERVGISKLAIGIALCLGLAGVFLIVQRNGLLAWLGLLLGAGLCLKALRRPARTDPYLTGAVAALWAVTWAGVFYYVIATWEGGEVVELTVETAQGEHSARTWIMEDSDQLLVYYDAPGPIAQALVSGAPLTVLRDGAPLVVTGYTAALEEDVSEQEADRVFALMADQYGDKTDAATVFYGLLGRSRDRLGVVIRFPRSPQS
ncbi:MAG: hypothetical protein NXH85_03550 [Pseudomonadaceae bacterium]|nr:hypothetical protein [Pseudomonadaceae bacterium]